MADAQAQQAAPIVLDLDLEEDPLDVYGAQSGNLRYLCTTCCFESLRTEL